MLQIEDWKEDKNGKLLREVGGFIQNQLGIHFSDSLFNGVNIKLERSVL